MFSWKVTGKIVLTAAIGGALAGGSTAMLDPSKFGIRLGNGKLFEMMLEGAIVAVAALFMKRPTDDKAKVNTAEATSGNAEVKHEP